jgi:hypothetical protein
VVAHAAHSTPRVSAILVYLERVEIGDVGRPAEALKSPPD